MPFVNIKVAGTITTEQKNELYRKTAEMLQDVLGKNPKSTYTIIEEVSTNNWAVGADSLTELNKKQ